LVKAVSRGRRTAFRVLYYFTVEKTGNQKNEEGRHPAHLSPAFMRVGKTNYCHSFSLVF